jgi:DNA-binding transcriptional LysR family regulator
MSRQPEQRFRRSELRNDYIKKPLVVAEELHFGRAAERLGIAQPPLSRAIRQVERRLGVTLLDRAARPLALTAAGEVLLVEARAALAAVGAAVRRTRRAGRAEPRLVLAVKPGGEGGLLPAILERYAALPGAVPVDLVFTIGRRGSLVRDGEADVTLLHRPRNDLTGLDAADLITEEQVAVLPRRHRLACRTTLRLADLAGETLPRWPDSPDDGATGPLVQDGGQLMQLIALGRTIAVVPESVRDHLRADLTCVPVEDAAPTTLPRGRQLRPRRRSRRRGPQSLRRPPRKR